MASLERTAYPRLRQLPSDDELQVCYGLNEDDEDFIRRHAHGDSQRLTLLLMYKVRQQLGYFPAIHSIPDKVRRFLAKALQLPLTTSTLNPTSQRKTRYRYRQIIRKKLGCRQYGEGGANFIAPLIRRAAYTMSDPADLINVAVKELFEANIELPAFSTLGKFQQRYVMRHSVLVN